ncbi:glycoside hydrolase family 15 protein [Streptomyces sp. NPDC085932]|uniref:glycoside hydrolase family 15 protein n=1 Tax=Streptomyces sp. NPDC085932 TaxID=3365741 RepID=UPI0037D35ECC
MPQRIEDYAALGDMHSMALVGRNGSIDWLCWPRFDSAACFAALLGDERHGRWRLWPTEPVGALSRRYLPGTMVLRTEYTTAGGTVEVLECMPVAGPIPSVVRVVRGLAGRVEMRSALLARFDYGHSIPWTSRIDGDCVALAGPNAIRLRTSVETVLRGDEMIARFDVAAGDTITFQLAWHPSHEPASQLADARTALEDTQRWWSAWAGHGVHRSPWRRQVQESLTVLKALTYAPTGGLLAAATTSLPEEIGGSRNWDYRYCWLRDAGVTLRALTSCGYLEEATAFRDWLLRAVAGDPDQMQIVYGVAGERCLPEFEVDWLPGHQGSRPVRIGNAAAKQFQLDVYGGLVWAMDHAERAGLPPDPGGRTAGLLRACTDFIVDNWQKPDEGLWEVRGARQHFTVSKLMSWVGVDRAIRAVEAGMSRGPLERWRRVRQEIHDDICAHAFDRERGTFVQAYGSTHLDASLLLLPIQGFLPPDDPRITATVEAIRRDLALDGFVARYSTADGTDGLQGGEATFLACSFWMVDALALVGRVDEAGELFERLLAVRNEVGLLAEEYDPVSGCQLGNFPQAYSHVGLVFSADCLVHTSGAVTV